MYYLKYVDFNTLKNELICIKKMVFGCSNKLHLYRIKIKMFCVWLLIILFILLIQIKILCSGCKQKYIFCNPNKFLIASDADRNIFIFLQE